jgi:hypothetical protein
MSGLNAGLDICFWCGEAIGITIPEKPGKHPENAYAKTFSSYEPCDTCREKMEAGFTLIECSKEQPDDGRPAISTHTPDGESGGSVYPTSRWWVMDMDAANRFFKKEVVKEKIVFIDQDTTKMLGLVEEE